MPDFRLNVSIERRGPLLDAAASKAAANRMIIQVNDLLAQEGVNRVHVMLRQVLRNPTGYYQSNIIVERRQVYRGVTDNKVAYGGWLEGVDSRNRTTRFKGYRTFRIVKDSLQRDADKIVQPAIDQFVKEMQ